jgi:hypothetical protein
MVNGVQRPWWWWAPRRPAFARATVALFSVGGILDIVALVLKADDPTWRLLFAVIFGSAALGGALSLRATNRVLVWEQQQF